MNFQMDGSARALINNDYIYSSTVIRSRKSFAETSVLLFSVFSALELKCRPF